MSTATSPQQTPVAETTGTTPAGVALRLVETTVVEERARHRRRNAFRDEEHDLQGHALALESHCLRRRAERYAQAVERGAALGDERVDAVLRAFRAYRPFVFTADREQNDAARRRLTRAVRDSRSRRHDVAVTPDASVA